MSMRRFTGLITLFPRRSNLAHAHYPTDERAISRILKARIGKSA
jgi:hypothetical protein